jgi:hypothetical protein
VRVLARVDGMVNVKSDLRNGRDDPGAERTQFFPKGADNPFPWSRRLARYTAWIGPLTDGVPFSIRPSPNRACDFHRTRLSSGRILRKSGGCAPITGGYDYRRTTPPASRLPQSLPFRSTCPPSPCSWLSQPPTTTRAPSPWGSRPTGDPAFPLGRQTARLRCSVRPVMPSIWRAAPPCGSLPRSFGETSYPGVLGSDVIRGVGLCTAGDWSSVNPDFTISCGSCRAASYTSSGVPRFDGMLQFPLAFAAR